MSDPGLFALWVRERRKELDLTQEGLAQRSGLSASAVWKIEVGQRKPSVEAAQMLAEALLVPSEERARFLRLARGITEVEGNTPNNLPSQLTPLLGRDEELATLTELHLTNGVRLVTVTGPPGIGKTRLAPAAAGSGRATYRQLSRRRLYGASCPGVRVHRCNAHHSGSAWAARSRP